MADESTVTIEVEYSLENRSYSPRWTFGGYEPVEAKDYAVSRCVPDDATIHRVGGWHGTESDRPEGGHEDDIFEEDNDE